MGFSGVGKTFMVEEIAKAADLPLIKIDCARFASDKSDGNAATNFISELESRLFKTRYENPDKKIIILFDELDKIWEIQGLNVVDRPVLSIINTLLDQGEYRKNSYTHINIRDAYVISALNFPLGMFNMEPDPRITSPENMMDTWRQINASISTKLAIMSQMFKPHTVNRLAAREPLIAKPLVKAHYQKLIKFGINVALKELYGGPEASKIKIDTTDGYLEYLYQESVIPTEGGRKTKSRVVELISKHVTGAINSLPRRYRGLPVTLTLDASISWNLDHKKYLWNLHAILSKAVVNKKSKVVNIDLFKSRSGKAGRLETPTFPPLEIPISESIPVKIWEVSAHEYGHALTALRFGLPIEKIIVHPLLPGAGGFVQYKGQDNLLKMKDLWSRILTALGSRAMERIMFSVNPLSRVESSLSLTTGSSADLESAAQIMTVMMSILGGLGTTKSDYGSFQRGSQDALGKLAPQFTEDMMIRAKVILSLAEQYLVRVFHESEDIEKMKSNVEKLARKGYMTPEEFLELNPELTKLKANEHSMAFRGWIIDLLSELDTVEGKIEIEEFFEKHNSLIESGNIEAKYIKKVKGLRRKYLKELSRSSDPFIQTSALSRLKELIIDSNKIIKLLEEKVWNNPLATKELKTAALRIFKDALSTKTLRSKQYIVKIIHTSASEDVKKLAFQRLIDLLGSQEKAEEAIDADRLSKGLRVDACKGIFESLK